MEQKIRILDKIVPSFIDYPDNESLCLCVVMMGCTHNCKGCQNPLFQNPEYDNGTKIVTVEELYEDLTNLCKRNRTDKIVLSGGDVLSSYNINFTKELLNMIKNMFDVCIYTGYDIDYVKENDIKGFKFIKTGTYIEAQSRPSSKDDTKIIFASPNQKLYNEEYKLLSNDGIYKFN